MCVCVHVWCHACRDDLVTFIFHFSLTLVESIPENLTYTSGSPLHTSTYQAWSVLLEAATRSVDIASYYWTMRGTGNVSDVTDSEVSFSLGRYEAGSDARSIWEVSELIDSKTKEAILYCNPHTQRILHSLVNVYSILEKGHLQRFRDLVFADLIFFGLPVNQNKT